MEVAITHSSTACILLEIGSVRILTDPVFDAEERRYRFGPGVYTTRYRGPAISPDDVAPLDAVLLSHAHHPDNLDDGGKAILHEAREVITSVRGRRYLWGKATGLEPWMHTTIFGGNGERIRVIATPARHGPWWLPEVRDVVGFVLEWEGQKQGALYISGDTIFFSGIKKIARDFKISTAILHLGAVHLWPPMPSFIRFTFNGREAAATANLLAARTVIPIHYEPNVWGHFRESIDSYREEFARAGVADAVTWLEPGTRTLIEV